MSHVTACLVETWRRQQCEEWRLVVDVRDDITTNENETYAMMRRVHHQGLIVQQLTGTRRKDERKREEVEDDTL